MNKSRLLSSINPIGLIQFIKESNKIEGITRDVNQDEITAHDELLSAEGVDTERLSIFVSRVQPGAELRAYNEMNVYVGSHIPPPGGPFVATRLMDILSDAMAGQNPWKIHCRYEILHPYMDGNGRSGRALWLWQMLRQNHGDPYVLTRGFLHTFYYQTLSNSR